MKKSRIITVLFAAIFIVNTVSAQDWVKKMSDPKANFYDIQNEFNAYWQGKTIEKGKGWKQFKRWEWFWEPRVFPMGNFPSKDIAWIEYYKYQAAHQNATKTSKTANWTLFGPSSWILGPSGYSPGIGRINCIAVDPTNSNTIYVGAPAGGLWKTTDGGSTWVTTTDDLPVIGVSSIVIDPNNTSTLWMATGDGDGSDTYSVGILKSTDGGNTWNTTGFSQSVDNNWRIYKLIMNPSRPQSQLIVSNGGIYMTYDGWSNYNFIKSGIYKDIEYKPGDTTTVYACGDAFYKSTDGGASFTQISSGLPLSSDIRRMAIAVTDANSAYVYIVTCNDSDYGVDGVYRSTDNGTNFTQQSGTNPNLLGWDTDGLDAGGQGWYDLAIAVSPSNASEVFVGGVNIWKSTDGGANWAINCHWIYQTDPNAYVHADIHALEYIGTTLYCGSDGGFFKTTNSGALWTDLSAGLEITQYYRMGGYPSDANYIFAGSQDNGISKFSGGIHYSVYGGDGMHCIIDPSNSNTVYVENQNGSIKKTTDGGDNFSYLVKPVDMSESGAWISPFAMDPINSQTLYVAYENVHKSTDGGTFWNAISNLGLGGTKLRYMAVAPSNSNYIYTSTYDALYMTNDGGANWYDVTTGLPVASASISNIAVDPANSSKVYVTFSGYVAGEKVYVSTNGGTSWTNISGTLANLPVICVKPHTSSNNDVYVGTDVGMYLRNDSIGDWIDYNSGLPNTPVYDINIHSGTSQIRAATRGRGIWTSALFTGGGGGASTPANNNVCGATSITINAAPISDDNTNANAGTDPAGSCWNGDGTDPAEATLWYSFVAPGPDTVTISTYAGTLTDAQLVLFSSSDGTCTGTLTEDACDEDGGANYMSEIIFTGLTTGNTYFILFDGWGGDIGTFSIEIIYSGSGGAPVNNDVCGAVSLTVNGSAYYDDNSNATAGSDPSGSCWYGSDGTNASLWYSFTAPASGSVTITTDLTTGTLDDTQLALFSSPMGSCTGTLTEIDCNDDVSSSNYLSTINATGLTSGLTYYVLLDGYGTNLGDFYIQVTSTTFITELAFDNGKVELYPNPVSKELNFKFTFKNNKNIIINIYNTAGEKVYFAKKNNVKSDFLSINLGNQPSGNYLVEIRSGSDVLTKKIIKL